MNKRLFVDMDGTLARFHDEAQYLERMFEKGFFKNLKPFQEAVDGIRQFIAHNPKTEVYILSAAIKGEPPYSVGEKHLWISTYLPEVNIEHRIFTDMEKPKTNYIPGGVQPTDFLYDDYNKNLEEWERAGGVAIKCKNNINHKGLVGDLWQGKIIDNSEAPSIIAYSLKKEIGLSAPAQIKPAYPKHRKGISI